MLVKGDATVNKLILLFVFDKMETALSENTVDNQENNSETQEPIVQQNGENVAE